MNNVDISIMFWTDKHHLDSDKEYSETVIFCRGATGEQTIINRCACQYINKDVIVSYLRRYSLFV
jgi:hypothetical protein